MRTSSLLRSRTVATVTGAAALLAGGYGLSYAVDSPDELKACATAKGVVVGATDRGKCPKGTRKVTLNAAGVAGPAGPPGPAGPVGPGTTAFGTDTNRGLDGETAVECTLGDVWLSASTKQTGAVVADGRLLRIADHTAVFSLIRDAYGGNGTTTFALPDLTEAAPDGLTYVFCMEGYFPALD